MSIKLNLLHCGDFTNGHPLYRHTEDQPKGQVRGQTPSIFVTIEIAYVPWHQSKLLKVSQSPDLW
jgi:hypothetical protein